MKTKASFIPVCKIETDGHTSESPNLHSKAILSGTLFQLKIVNPQPMQISEDGMYSKTDSVAKSSPYHTLFPTHAKIKLNF